jgi:hypothetical protein
MDLFKLVIVTLPRYVDAESRDAVLNLAEALVRRDELPEGEPDARRLGQIKTFWVYCWPV